MTYRPILMYALNDGSRQDEIDPESESPPGK